MIEGVLIWQAIIFFSIAFAGQKRGWVIAFWIAWTILQVFALWLSLVQFFTIWVAWLIFGQKAPSPSSEGTSPSNSPSVALPEPPVPIAPPTSIDAAAALARREKERQEDEEFQRKLASWLEAFGASSSNPRWIPSGASSRFLGQNAPPVHPRKSWKQVVGDLSPADTLKSAATTHNSKHLQYVRSAKKAFFNSVEKNPLTDEQIHACICMDDAVMVVAAAGSGKTSTLVAKTGYVLKEGIASPDQVLLLSFNRATADEVGDRISKQLKGVPNVDRVRSNTFHAFGIDVIAAATGKKPSLAPWVDPSNPGGDVREIGDIIRELCEQSSAFRRDWDLFRTVYARDVGKWGEPGAPEAYANGKRGFLTAQGEIVKSTEERVIADWLFYNGVSYKYEEKYEHDTADRYHGQYFPDFYYPEIRLYHEHFALDAEGKAPPSFKGYLEGVAWKRRIHAELGTELIETTSNGLLRGDAIASLERELRKRGLNPAFTPGLKPRGLEPVNEADLARSFRVFQQHVKNNGLSGLQLQQSLKVQSKDGFGARLSLYLSIYERIAEEWERRLRAGGFIDFEDMLVLAASHVESGAYKSPYTVIMADEFQDSSRARIRLLKALVKAQRHPAHLCVVGDDWQGINRFAGSDITVMTEFEKTFDYATRLKLNTTFRCPQDVCNVSSQFIQVNPAQIKKSVRTTNPLTKTPMLAYGFQDLMAIAAYVEEQLDQMHRLVGEGKLSPSVGKQISVLILGRYRDDAPVSLESWKKRFGDRLRIEFKTAHGSKGMEAEYVFVLNVTEGTRGFPSQIQDDPALQLAMPAPDVFPFAEERRLFYVAMTRARKQVRFYTTLAAPSRFLLELAKNGHIKIEAIDGEPIEPCPACGQGRLQLRNGKYGSFYGCTRFPACDFKRKVDDAGGPKTGLTDSTSQRLPLGTRDGDQCPVCKLGVVRQRTGRNGLFLGCSRYREGCRATGNLA
ncbi:MAG: UvrD-helicase domain-containing protein [Rhizobiaceae bacterium]|nr:UvrD-helicase domain-containing protein [Rhizobiaceae bacterium]